MTAGPQPSAVNGPPTRRNFVTTRSAALDGFKEHAPILTVIAYVLAIFASSILAPKHGMALVLTREKTSIGLNSYINIAGIAIVTLMSVVYVVRNILQKGNLDRLVLGYLSKPLVLALSLLYLFECFSAVYATVPVGALYQTVPGLMTVVFGCCLYIYTGEKHNLTRMAELWHIANGVFIIQLSVLLISGFLPDGRGLRSEPDALLPVRLYGSWFSIHPDFSGLMATVGLVHFSVGRPKRNIFDYISIMVCLATFVLAQYRTSYIMASVVMIFTFVLYPAYRLMIGLIVAAIAGVSALKFESILNILSRGQNQEDIMTMSGRTTRWIDAFEFGSLKKWYGHGAYSGINIDLPAYDASHYKYMILSSVDNAYLNVFVDIGMFGVILLIFVLFGSTWGSLVRIRKPRNIFNVEMFLLSLCLLIRSWSAGGITERDPTQLYIIFLVTYIIVVSPVSRTRAGTQGQSSPAVLRQTSGSLPRQPGRASQPGMRRAPRYGPNVTKAAAAPPAEVQAYVRARRVDSVDYDGELAVGQVLPDTIAVHQVPSDDRFQWANVNHQRILIASQSRKIVDIADDE